ncbi:hypothetical protein A8708_18090 [Paenibacillus oryzisoli]|uniref:Glycosyl hydrolase family 88 n=1 Tax=Paenibacillus oryzisoli TaxID=1850517 RepID=A0A198AHQ7_9BACL|nr:hypothetical protein A8708_18090 [Paenibacillus oryzisoli]
MGCPNRTFLSLLFWASEISGDPRFKQIAVRHANTVLKYFIRPDGSVVHIASFDPETGIFLETLPGQGYGPNSAWSRGAAWAIYGLANTYRYTGELRYLDAAKRAAHFFLAALPEDQVPPWDFRTESENGEPKDSSAAAIAASGLLELAKHVPQVEAHLYHRRAERILQVLSEGYVAWEDETYEEILMHGTGHKPAGQISMYR